MPVVKNEEAREIPWRPGYRNYVLAGQAQGVSVSSSMGVLEQGAGAPLHFHEEVDEVIVVVEGTPFPIVVRKKSAARGINTMRLRYRSVNPIPKPNPGKILRCFNTITATFPQSVYCPG